MEKVTEHILQSLSKRYPQLLLPLASGEAQAEKYRDIVLHGKEIKGELYFSFSPYDTLTTFDTPAGKIEILYLYKREDFEHCICALAHKCQPVIIPATQGASIISGLINWQKIRQHKMQYLLSGGLNWNKEWEEFKQDKSRYTDTLIVLSSGYYSSVAPEDLGLTPADWQEKSLVIRKYHELTHFICRKKYPDDINALRDEILADAVGLFAAFSCYNPVFALRFLGINDQYKYIGGRLENYVSKERLMEAVQFSAALVLLINKSIVERSDIARIEDPFSLLEILLLAHREERFT